jgi:conjugal transfer pilin signal peptidase TrbI
MLWLPRHYTIGLNASFSLPHHVYLIRKGEMPQRGDYVAFRWHGGGPYPAGATFIKILAGLPGDAVMRRGRRFYVNGVPVGEAKTTSKEGAALDAGHTGVLPPGRYYVRAPHPDSLDSRYRLTGWIAQSEIIGRAYVLF